MFITKWHHLYDNVGENRLNLKKGKMQKKKCKMQKQPLISVKPNSFIFKKAWKSLLVHYIIILQSFVFLLYLLYYTDNEKMATSPWGTEIFLFNVPLKFGFEITVFDLGNCWQT